MLNFGYGINDLPVRNLHLLAPVVTPKGTANCLRRMEACKPTPVSRKAQGDQPSTHTVQVDADVSPIHPGSHPPIEFEPLAKGDNDLLACAAKPHGRLTG